MKLCMWGDGISGILTCFCATNATSSVACFQLRQVKRKTWFRFHDSYALGTELLADCFSFMQTPEQYRAFAEECECLAKQTEDEHHRKVLREMAKEWIKLAEEADGGV